MRLLRLLVESAELLGVGRDRAESGNLAALVEVFGIFDRQWLAFGAAGVELRSVELLFAVGKPNAIDRRRNEAVGELSLLRSVFHDWKHFVEEFATAVLHDGPRAARRFHADQ